MVEQETIQPEYFRIGIAGNDAAQENFIKKYFDDFLFSKDQTNNSKGIRARFTLKDGKNIVAEFFVMSRRLTAMEIRLVDAIIFVCDLRDKDSLGFVEFQLKGHFERLKDNTYLTILALDAENKKELKLSYEKVSEFAEKWRVSFGVLKESEIKEIKEQVNTVIEEAYKQYCNHRKLKNIAFKEHWQNRKKKDNFCSNCGC